MLALVRWITRCAIARSAATCRADVRHPGPGHNLTPTAAWCAALQPDPGNPQSVAWDGDARQAAYTSRQTDNNAGKEAMRKRWLMGGGVAIIVVAAALLAVSRASTGPAETRTRRQATLEFTPAEVTSRC